jgi:hypothetical protein
MQTEESDISAKTPREILQAFYAENHLDSDGGQSKPYVKIELTSGFHFYFPNFDERRRAVIKHDIHHLITGYETTMAGESEISAWEIASGCKSYWAAFFIDTSGLMMGFLLFFPRVLKAFARGRKTGNLYHDAYTTEQALDIKIGEMQKQFSLDAYPKNTKPTFTDFILLCLFAIFGGIYSILSLALLPYIVVYSTYTEVKIRMGAKTAV